MSIPQTRLEIRFYGDPVLRKRAKSVKTVTEKERAILQEMDKLMHCSGGIGLAAPQVGINQQMVLVDVGEGLIKLINPRVTKKIGLESMEEGCLSLPGIYVVVKRAKKIIVRGLNAENENISISASGLLARALQHEIDHLKGRLIIDYTNFIQRIKFRKKLKNLQRIKSNGRLL